MASQAFGSGAGTSNNQASGIEDHESAPYTIENEIGKGSLATFYRGFHRDTHATFAIKTVSRASLTPKSVAELESEIVILKGLKHYHIIELVEIIKAERFIFLIMEDCTGGDLSGYLKCRGRVEGFQYIPEPGTDLTYYPHPLSGGLDVVAVRSFLRQMARALKFLRQRRIIHRDIKPQNFLLKPATEADHKKGHPLGIPLLKMAGFGFAGHLPDEMLAETLCGTPLYMAPEILRYEKYDAKADLWSVGVTLYEISVGKLPFRAQNHIELLKRIEQARSTVRFPDEEDPRANQVPSDIKKLIWSLLKRHPVERVTFDEFFLSRAVANSKFHHPPSHDEASSSPPPNSASSVIPITHEKHLSTLAPVIMPHTAANQPPISITPGPSTQAEVDDESILESEYVIVRDARNVEFNQRVDELNAARLRSNRRISETPSDEASPSNSPAQLRIASSLPIELNAARLPKNERTSEAFLEHSQDVNPTLEKLMTNHIPLDLTGHVVIPDRGHPIHGGLADVHAGWLDDTAVAVKIFRIRKSRRTDPEGEASNERRIRREMHVWAALRHPNICEFLGYSTDFSDYSAMVSKWCRHGTAADYLESQKPSIHERLKLALDVSEGLLYLHNLKIVHGDLKPNNILIDDSFSARLCDFGLVRLVDFEGPTGLTTTSPYTGTERYKAPELFISAENRYPVATFEGDIYSLGSVMLEFIELLYPFQRFKRAELRNAIMEGYSPALRSESSGTLLGMTDFFWGLLEVCWSESSRRPSIKEIVGDLQSLVQSISLAS